MTNVYGRYVYGVTQVKKNIDSIQKVIVNKCLWYSMSMV